MFIAIGLLFVIVALFVFLPSLPSDSSNFRLVNVTVTNSSENGIVHSSTHDGNMTTLSVFFGKYSSGGLFTDSRPVTKQVTVYDPEWKFRMDSKVIVIKEEFHGTCVDKKNQTLGLISIVDGGYQKTCYPMNVYVELDK